MLRAKEYKLKQTNKQEQLLLQTFGNCRWIYNRALNRKTTEYKNTKKNISAFDLMKEIKILKKENERLSLSPSQSLQHSIVNMETAFKNFFKGGGFPKWKNKRSKQSFHIPQGVKVDYTWNGIFLPKIGWVKLFKDKTPIVGEIRNATISKRASGYYVNIVYETESRNYGGKGDIGIDVGLKDFIITSDGDKISPLKAFINSQSKLRKLQRHLSRQQEKSHRRIKTKKQIAILYEKITNSRKDFIHKTTTLIAKRYEIAYVENLNVKGMMQNRKLSKAIGDAGWGMLITILKNKMKVIEIGRFAPSSKMCSNCGYVYGELKLTEREWTCSECGTRHDRDINASKNILQMGRKVFKD